MKSQDGTGGDSEDAMDRLHSAAIRLLRSMRPLDARSGVSGPKLSVLSVLVVGGPQSLSALADAEGVRRPTMTQLINALEADGLVRKRLASADKRRVQVQATARGRKLLTKGRARRLNDLVARFRALSRADQKVLLRALDAFERLAHRDSKKSKS